MDASDEWADVAQSPTLKNLTDGRFGELKASQCQAVQDLVKAHIDSFDQAVSEGLSRVVQAIPPLEFSVKGERISLAFVEAAVYPPTVSKGNVCREMRVFPAECRARRCTYRGKMVADVSWAVDGVPKGIIKQSLGQLPVMVKSRLCNLRGMTPQQLVRHHEEAEEMGGYFIVNGMEKVIRMLIMPRRNYPIAMSRPKWKSRGQGYTQYGSKRPTLFSPFHAAHNNRLLSPRSRAKGADTERKFANIPDSEAVVRSVPELGCVKPGMEWGVRIHTRHSLLLFRKKMSLSDANIIQLSGFRVAV